MMIVPRRSNERGNIDYGWLKTFHTFSFGSYQYSGHESFGSLRAINENRVSAHTGFGVHSHSNFEVLRYVVSGELQHNDSLGTTRILKRGDVQLTSAGTGVYHSETAQNGDVHLLEIWSSQALSTLAPSHFIRHFSDEEKLNGWVRIAAPVNASYVYSDQDDGGSAPIRSAMVIYATCLASGLFNQRSFQLGSSMGYIHVIQTSGYNVGTAGGAKVKLSGGDSGITEVELREGDGAYMMFVSGKKIKVQNIGAGIAEVLLFEID
ncbi:RmlC-like cupin [Athelia psychrophila]|uniref:RmlC-like cupin n=1 Tax=Athelia psychrophila TaxID=1759441 RepID=A0A166A0T1_9AGAM|nr:RmlC-like cupin [Fibularhizoctonia sp. CBS 109695]